MLSCVLFDVFDERSEPAGVLQCSDDPFGFGAVIRGKLRDAPCALLSLVDARRGEQVLGVVSGVVAVPLRNRKCAELVGTSVRLQAQEGHQHAFAVGVWGWSSLPSLPNL
jgi:hypothetical protein